ncbi:hypothetical protein [Amycolatopsis sp. NPDC051128]|uniref:hypothetical protein n=1 Tax=Amycolatopsis sp. NPDC051128 TaxID=3155412 RepID=UPI00341D6231
MTSRSTVNSPLTMLQNELRQPRVVARFDQALQNWAVEGAALAEIACHADLADVLATREYDRHDEVLHALLARAAISDRAGVTATEIVVNAMLPVVPGIVGCVVRSLLSRCATRKARGRRSAGMLPSSARPRSPR